MANKSDTASVPVKHKREKREGTRMPRPFEDIDQLFDRFMERVYPHGWHMGPHREWRDLPQLFGGQRPNVDVIDRDDEVVVRAELPGVEKKDLEVSLGDTSLTIKAVSSYEKEESREMAHGTFARTIALPCEVDEAGASATFSNGVLELTMPKLARAKRRRITVR